ncbi:hypothetical protein Mapa_009729 [Marchantia paleacea]|nr:hypothetical protein Mapa_009729 [Marchantia paleacea]
MWTVMNSELWGSLPQHLVELVLRSVPFREVIHLRCVCKKWNEYILNISRITCPRALSVRIQMLWFIKFGTPKEKM